MDFFIDNLPLFLRAVLIGGLFGWCFSKISNLKTDFEIFKSTQFNSLESDIYDLMTERPEKIGREELIKHINYINQRILVIETKMEERYKSK